MAAVGTLIRYIGGIFWRFLASARSNPRYAAWRVKLVVQADLARQVTWKQVLIRVATAGLPLLAALIPFVYTDINNAHIAVYLFAGTLAVMGMLWRFTNRPRHYLHDVLSGTELLQTPKRAKQKKQ